MRVFAYPDGMVLAGVFGALHVGGRMYGNGIMGMGIGTDGGVLY